MREKEKESSPRTLFMISAQVKQNLVRLEKDGETRRNALNSLKHCVETMDGTSVPRFVAQVSETREKGTSRALAISLYEDVARVHGKLIIPHIPRVMTAITRTLSASGSSPQLQQVCAKVISAIVKHAIDESSPSAAADVLRQLCDPLLEVLAGRLEPLAAGAAVCLQILVESERWKYATDDLVDDVCMRTSVALAEKGTRTVAHMLLAQALATTNSSSINGYGVSLLRSGVEALKSPYTSSWQQRASAARLLTVVLPAVDRATLAEELTSIAEALDSCKHDRMSNVRLSVKEALKTARVILADENLRRSSFGEDPLPLVIPHPPPISHRRTLSGGSTSTDDMSPVWASKTKDITRAPSSPVSVISLSPSAPSADSISSGRAKGPFRSSGGSQVRSPLRATRLHEQVGSFDHSSITSVNHFESPRKENLPSLERDTKICGDHSYDAGETTPTSTSKHAQQKLLTQRESSISSPESLGEEADANEQYVDQETRPAVISKGRERQASPRLEDSTISLARDNARVAVAGREVDVVSFSNGGASTDVETRSHDAESPRFVGLEADKDDEFDEMSSSRESRKDSTANRGGFGSNGLLDVSNMKYVFELKGPVSASVFKSVVQQPLRTEEVDDISEFLVASPTTGSNDWKEPPNGQLGSPSRIDSPTNLMTMCDASGSREVRGLNVAEDLLPLTTPRRFVRSLQASFSTISNDFANGSNSLVLSQDLTAILGEEVVDNTSTADMDLGTPTSSSTGWSVRTNPIASDGSLKTDSDDSDAEQGRPTWKTMAPTTPPAQETENPDNDDGFRHRIIHPVATEAFVVSQENEVDNTYIDFSLSSPPLMQNLQQQQKLSAGDIFNERDIIKRNISWLPLNRMIGDNGDDGLRILLPGAASVQGEDLCVDKWSCSEVQSPRSDNGVIAAASIAEEVTHDASPTLTSSTATSDHKSDKSADLKRSCYSFREIVGRSWKNGRDALSSWQFCAVLIAIPFAIALSKVFFPSDPCYYGGSLVPT